MFNVFTPYNYLSALAHHVTEHTSIYGYLHVFRSPLLGYALKAYRSSFIPMYESLHIKLSNTIEPKHQQTTNWQISAICVQAATVYIYINITTYVSQDMLFKSSPGAVALSFLHLAWGIDSLLLAERPCDLTLVFRCLAPAKAKRMPNVRLWWDFPAPVQLTMRVIEFSHAVRMYVCECVCDCVDVQQTGVNSH